MKIYGNIVSRALRPIWCALEAGVDFEHVDISVRKGDAKSKDFLEKNPNGKIPVLEDQGQFIFESAAITTYIADLAPEKKLNYPVGSIDRAKVDQWMYWCMSEFESHLWTIAKNSFALPEEIRCKEIIPTSVKEFEMACKILSKELEDKDFIVNDHFTIADIFISQTLMWASKMDAIELSDQTLLDYMKRMRSRENFPNIKKYIYE